MDTIDITDSVFSLDVPGSGTNEIIDKGNIFMVGGSEETSTMFIYLGVAVFAVFFGIYIYRYYTNKNKNDEYNNLDCEGGFCNNPTKDY